MTNLLDYLIFSSSFFKFVVQKKKQLIANKSNTSSYSLLSILLLLKICTITTHQEMATKAKEEMTIPTKIQRSRLWNDGYLIKSIRQFKKVQARETLTNLVLMTIIIIIIILEPIQLRTITQTLTAFRLLDIPQTRTPKLIIVTQNRILNKKTGFLLMKVVFSLKIKMIME